MEPTKKSPAIADLLEALSGRTTAITNNRCVNPPIGCGLPATDFKTAMNEKEYRISGLCQACQDIVFGKPYEEADDSEY